MADTSLGTPDQLRDPNYTPALAKAVPLGIQHVLAMFVSNVTPAIIVAGAAGFGFGSNSPDFPNMIYMIQMSMLFAGIATLFQTIGFGPVGARLPIVQGTSFAFLPVMIPAVAGQGTAGLAGLMTGIVIGGLFHTFLGTFIGRLRFALPPLVTGLIVLMIGLALVKVGIQYAAGGVRAEVLYARDDVCRRRADRPDCGLCRGLHDGAGKLWQRRAGIDVRIPDTLQMGDRVQHRHHHRHVLHGRYISYRNRG